jgi:transcriptional regulator with XRE-family HTH domain
VARGGSEEQIRLGKWIRAQRIRAKMTQLQLADRLDIHYQALQRMEKGTARISATLLEGLAIAFEKPPSELMAEFSVVRSGGAPPSARTDGHKLTEDEKALLAAFNRILDKSLRRILLELIQRVGST